MPSSVTESSTSASLLGRVKVNDAIAWERLTALYTPMVYGWARKNRLGEEDAADVTQEVFRAVANGISRFGEEGKGTKFRAWLWGITRYKIQDHFRASMSQPQSAGGTNAHIRLSQIPEEFVESDDDSLADELARRAMDMIKTDFQESTWQAFYRVTIDGQKPIDIAQDLGISVSSVYTAKSRVLAHLRRELDGLS